jgi:hypothetical protein
MFSDTQDILLIAQEEIDVFERTGRHTSLELIAEVKRLRQEVEALRATSDRERELIANAIADLRFPVMLRRMWSGGDVQAWLAEQAEAMRDGHRSRKAYLMEDKNSSA